MFTDGSILDREQLEEFERIISNTLTEYHLLFWLHRLRSDIMFLNLDAEHLILRKEQLVIVERVIETLRLLEG